MRRATLLFPIAGLLLYACTSSGPAPDSSPTAAPFGLTVDEEAKVLAMEDSRAFDARLVKRMVEHSNSLHRKRIALALGRIGPHSFVDENANGKREDAEKRTGAAELEKLAADQDRDVRQTAVFALGELADRGSAQTLFYVTGDSDAAIAAEAAEAISKAAVVDASFRINSRARYLWLVDPANPEVVRARAARYLFRYDNDEASAAALRLLSEATPIRQEAAYSLARRAYAPAREQLQLLLTDPDVLTRAYAAAALGRIADSASAPALVAALGDVHPWVRTNAASALSKVADKDRAWANSPKDLPRIFAAVEDPDPGVRANMIDVLGAYASFSPEGHVKLVSILSNGTAWERELAAGAIARRISPQDPAYKLLKDLTPWQTVRVIEATANLPNGQEIRKRYAAHADALVRASVLSAIPDDKVDAEMAIVMKGLDDSDVIVRTNAYDRFGFATKVQPQLWVEKLRNGLAREEKEAMNDGRLAAMQALAKYRSRGRREMLEKALTDADPVLRRVAADTIEKEFDHEVRQYAPLQVSRTPKDYRKIVQWSRMPHTATIHMTRGVIEVALLTQDAPMTAWNFAQLAEKKYFDNSSFMRVVPNFVIQGGDPRNDMNGGPGYAIRDEINMQRYTRGAVGMALSGPDTGGSQFFVTHSPQPHLDGGYTIFGRVYEGMTGVVDQVERGDRVETITIDEHPPISGGDTPSETGLAPGRAGSPVKSQ